MALILIRGLGRESAHWGKFPARLLEADREKLIVGMGGIEMPECPGCGRLFNNPLVNSISEMRENVRAQVAGAQVDISGQKHVLLGLSMGGMVALDWANCYPREVGAVILVNSSSADCAFFSRLKPGAWPSLVGALFKSIAEREAILLKLVSNSPELYAERISAWQNIQRSRPVSNVSMLKLLLLASRFKVDNCSGVPGLVLASRGDRLVSYRCSESLADILSWPLFLDENSGHDIPMDNPDWLIQKILGLLFQISN